MILVVCQYYYGDGSILLCLLGHGTYDGSTYHGGKTSIAKKALVPWYYHGHINGLISVTTVVPDTAVLSAYDLVEWFYPDDACCHNVD